MKRLVLVGAGHAHAQVLKDWAAAPLPGVDVVLVSPSALAPYSGMVPGWLAGDYGYADICIDFAALAAAAGASWVEDEVVALNAERRRLTLRNTAALDYHVLSLNVGSTLTPPALPAVLCLRPLGALCSAWEAVLARLATLDPHRPLTVTAVGGGAAGVESLLAVRQRLLRIGPLRPVRARLVQRGSSLLPALAAGAGRRARRALQAAGVSLQLGSDHDAAALMAAPPDLLLWATGAEAQPWQARSGLAVNQAGFIQVDRCLRSTSHTEVLAAGDCAAWAEALPKAGVYAVRMGPVLSYNLRAALRGGSPRAYAPQCRVLSLLGTGGHHAIAAWGPWAVEGDWVWRWKDHIDRGFVGRYNRVGGGRIGGGRSGAAVALATKTTED